MLYRREKMNVKVRKGVNIGRVVAKIVSTVLALYVGGTIMIEIGNVMNNTTSPFYKGLTLIGWTVNADGLITSTSGSGILSVIGIIGIATIVMEFVQVSF
jgi:hypothetical protein